MSEESVTIELRIFGLNPVRNAYRIEASLDDGEVFQGEMRLDKEKLLALRLNPQEYGLLLFDALFDGAIRDGYMKAVNRAYERSKGLLRVRLWIDDAAAELQHEVSWERLVDESATKPTPLATSADTPFSRYIGLSIAKPEPVSDRPLRLLVVVSNPEGLPEGMAEVEVGKELLSLKQALSELSQENQVEVAVMPGRSGLSDDVRQQLEAAQFDIRGGESSLNNILRSLQDIHVLHFVGHGQFRSDGGQGGRAALYLEKVGGGWQAVDDETIAIRLRNLRPLPLLVFLAACESAVGDGQGPFVGLAPKLVQAGVPAVVAMSEKVEMAMARELTADFYRRLLDHGEVDLALNEARNLLLSLRSVDWAIPVLFMRLRDGRLLGQAAVARPVPPGDQRIYSSGPLDRESRVRIRKNLAGLFNLEELRTLCIDLEIDPENFPATKDGLARELVLYCERRGQVPDLITAVRQERPGVDW